jgi:hypothetical protein
MRVYAYALQVFGFHRQSADFSTEITVERITQLIAVNPQNRLKIFRRKPRASFRR